MRSFYHRHKQLIPLLPLLYGCVLIIVQGIFHVDGNADEYVVSSTITLKHVAAFAGFSACLLAYFITRRYYRYVFMTVMLLSFFNVMNFSFVETTLGFHISVLHITFGTSGLLAILMACIVNIDRLSGKLSVNDEAASERIRNDREIREAEETLRFKAKFAHKSEEELQEIARNEKFTNSAREAARQLLTDKMP